MWAISGRSAQRDACPSKNKTLFSMRNLIMTMMALALTIAAQAQETVTLTGQIKDAFTRQAIPDVTVTLMRADSTIWQRAMPSYAMLRVQWRFNYNPKKK